MWSDGGGPTPASGRAGQVPSARWNPLKPLPWEDKRAVGRLAGPSSFPESTLTKCSALQVNVQDTSYKWKLGRVLWKLAKRQETKGGSKKPKRMLIGEGLREQG